MARCQMEVVSVGLPESCADEWCPREHHQGQHPVPEVFPGDWVLVRPRVITATHDRTLFVAHQVDLLAVL